MKQSTFFSLILLSTSGAAIALALFMQYVLGYKPCTLCIYERWPYFITCLIGIRMLFYNTFEKFFTITAMLALLCGIMISTYHIGVELHIFTRSESCAFSYAKITAVKELYEQLAANDMVRCDIPLKLFGFSMTYFNFAYSVFILLILLAKKKIWIKITS